MTIPILSWQHPFAGTSRSRRRARFIPTPASAGTASRTSPQSGRRVRQQRPVRNHQRLSALSDLRNTISRQSRCHRIAAAKTISPTTTGGRGLTRAANAVRSIPAKPCDNVQSVSCRCVDYSLQRSSFFVDRDDHHLEKRCGCWAVGDCAIESRYIRPWAG